MLAFWLATLATLERERKKRRKNFLAGSYTFQTNIYPCHTYIETAIRKVHKDRQTVKLCVTVFISSPFPHSIVEKCSHIYRNESRVKSSTNQKEQKNDEKTQKLSSFEAFDPPVTSRCRLRIERLNLLMIYNYITIYTIYDMIVKIMILILSDNIIISTQKSRYLMLCLMIMLFFSLSHTLFLLK